MLEESASYDPFAWLYNRHWGCKATGKFLPVLRQHFLQELPPHRKLLDLCCGTGQLDGALNAIGYQVTGVDASPEMIRFARENAPGCEFLIADVRDFRLGEVFDGALCMYDSLNHLMNLDDLRRAFAAIRRALRQNAPFIFDLNTEEGFRSGWQGSFGIVDDDLVCVIRPSFREDDKIGEFPVTVMKRESGQGWQRSDIHLRQRCYSNGDITAALSSEGFSTIHILDLGTQNIGKSFFTCRA